MDGNPCPCKGTFLLFSRISRDDLSFRRSLVKRERVVIAYEVRDQPTALKSDDLNGDT